MPLTQTLDVKTRRAYPARSTTAGATKMGKVTINIPLITWRDGRPRFNPSPKARKEGWKGEDLKHPDGTWFNLDESISWSAKRQTDMVAMRTQTAETKPRRAKRGAPGKNVTNSVGHVFALWQQSPRFKSQDWVEDTGRKRKRRKPLAPKTIKFYQGNTGIFQDRFPDAWAEPAAALSPAIVDGFFEILEDERGIATARAVIATLRSALSFGVKRGLLKSNPAKDLHLPMPEPRLRCASIAEIRALVRTADATGRMDLADMILFAVTTGQRQADRVSVIADQITDNQLVLRQAKRGKLVSVKILPFLAERLKHAQERRKIHKVQWPQLFINEVENEPWNIHKYRNRYDTLRKATVAGVMGENGDWISAPCPSVADLTDQDFRDTNQTWLANGGATDVEMAAIAGHSEATAAQTRKHYVVVNKTQSAHATDKLDAWLKGEGADF